MPRITFPAHRLMVLAASVGIGLKCVRWRLLVRACGSGWKERRGAALLRQAGQLGVEGWTGLGQGKGDVLVFDPSN